MAEEDSANVFAFPDFSLSTKWLNLSRGDLFFNLDVEATNERNPHNILDSERSTTSGGGFFKIPDELVPLEPGSQDERNEESREVVEPLHDIALPDLDIIDELWYTDPDRPAPQAEYKTWEGFDFPEIPHSAPLFLSEAGPSMYDTAILDEDDPLNFNNVDHLVVKSNPYLAALVAVALGRGSVFFKWDDTKDAFIPVVAKMRISGYSTEVLQGLQQDCLRSGTMTRRSSRFVQLTYRTRPSAVRVALATVVDHILLAIQQKFGERGQQVKSLLQLQSLVIPVHSILCFLQDIVEAVCKKTSDEEAISEVFRQAERIGDDSTFLGALMCEVLSRVAKPWVEFTEKWIGVKGEEGFPLTKDGPGKSFAKVRDIAKVDDLGFEFEERDYVLDEACMPSFIPSDIALVMFETGRNLRLLRTHHPEHPLCHIYDIVPPPGIKWLFDWKSVEDARIEVEKYEMAVLEKLYSKSSEGITHSGTEATHTRKKQRVSCEGILQVFGNDGSQLESQLLASIQALNQAPSIGAPQDTLSTLLKDSLFSQDSKLLTVGLDRDLHWSLVPLHSFGSLVTAQARLINREYMKLLFNVHGLREHVHIQKEFQLLGNGMFCSRLSHALFDPDLETAERKAGVALNGGIMGLRLNGRETWPPASSELRLALMGILTETYLPLEPRKSSHSSKPETSDLPGDLSFALRDLSPEEIEKCMDPTSLEALDFLRLAYKTPAPLSPIITPVILVKYDKIFKLLIRVLRMLYVVGQLFRDTTKMLRRDQELDNVWLRFRFEAQHFVQSMATYFFDTGIQIPWLEFEKYLDAVESTLEQAGTDAMGTRVVSPDEVREEHEKMLDRIMNTLLLRKRQQPVMALVEETFNLILKFSRQVQLEVSGKVEENASRVIIQDLYRVFRKRMEVLVTVCHGLSERGGTTGRDKRQDLMADDVPRSDGSKAENMVDRLLASLDMLGHYSRPRF